MKRNITSALCVLLTVISLSACQLSNNKKLAGNVISHAAQEVLQDEYSENSSTTDQNADDAEEVQNGKASNAATPVCGLPEVSKGTPEKILKRFAYTCSFNPENNIPNWVAWELTADHTDGPYKRGGIKFQEDEGVTTYDYTRSGYDRGHMCPSGDNKWSEEAQEESFLMTNMCLGAWPQRRRLERDGNAMPTMGGGVRMHRHHGKGLYSSKAVIRPLAMPMSSCLRLSSRLSIARRRRWR